MKKGLLFILMAVLAVIIAACGSASSSDSSSNEGSASTDSKTEEEELVIQHELGETTVQKNPEKVVVFDFGALDTLDKLGVEVAGVPQENVPSYLSKYEGETYENVGSLKEPDFEKISEIAPDLILISGRQAEAYEELSKIAPTVFIGVDTTNYMESFANNVTMLGEIFGKEEQAKEELATMTESVKQLNEKASASGKNGLIILSTGGKISAYGPGSRFGIIHDEFGVTPVDENIEASTHGMSVTFEYIAEKNPDYLFVIDRDQVVGGETEASKVLDNELVNDTKAAQNGNIVYLDPEIWYLSGGGLTSVAEMVKEVDEAIQ